MSTPSSAWTYPKPGAGHGHGSAPVQVYPDEGDARQSGASEALLEAVDHEVRALVDACYAQARRLLREVREKHEAIVAALLERETLDEAEAYGAAGIVRRPGNQHLVGMSPGSPGPGNA